MPGRVEERGNDVRERVQKDAGAKAREPGIDVSAGPQVRQCEDHPVLRSSRRPRASSSRIGVQPLGSPMTERMLS